MKKTATKTAVVKSSAAEKKTPVVKAAVAKIAKAVKSTVAPAVKAAKAAKPAKTAATIKAPSPKAKAKPAAVTTTIVAVVDVGFGNSLAIRGVGPGLSWDVGLVMDCVADDRWSITLPESSQPIVCKFLLNDSTWCSGEDYTVLPGSSVVVSPSF